ncbi:MAG TPA: ATP synthase F1 subunit gamma [Phycisphaerae bacterium]|nr:ATP synthase F1 subunit gamma [Phycisphaerae bacterium]
MAKARQIVKRRKAVANIRKITNTMRLIATARFQQAYTRAMAAKPYTEKITALVEEVSKAAGDQVDNALLRDNPDAGRDLLLVLTSNRGLCGGYNGQVLRTALRHLNETKDRPHELQVVGKKGVAYFRFLGRPVDRAITGISDRPRFDQIEPIAAEYIKRYEAGEFGSVRVAYMRFISAGRQAPEILRLLPLSPSQPKPGERGSPAVPTGQVAALYDFSPEPGELFNVLLPQTVKVRLFQCFIDAAVSEETARKVAMKAATDAADDMIKLLSRQFNRARQTQITMELLDIVGGAEALK